MKNIVSIIILSICFVASSFAQWRVIYPNEKYNYFKNNQSDSIIRTTLWVDSTKTENGDSVYYLNKVFQNAGYVNGPFGQHQILLINQAQFLRSKIILTANNVQQIVGDANWLINGNCSLGDSWIFDSVTNAIAHCDSVYLKTFFGITDSVKRIEINFTDTILLSKNYGVLTFPSFDSAQSAYNLVGLENLSLGLTIPKAYSFCNFNIGDEFEYKSGSSYTVFTSGAHTSTSEVCIRYNILSKWITADSVTYQVYGKRRIESNPFGGPLTIQVDTSIIDTIIYKLNNTNNFLNEKYNMQYVYQQGLIYLSVFEKDTIGNGYRKQYNSSVCSVYNQDSILLGPLNPVAYHENSNNDYSQVFGLISIGNSSGSGGFPSGSGQSSYKYLLACTINGNQYGQYLTDNTYHDCSLDSINGSIILSDKDTLIDGDTTAILLSSVQANSYLWSTGSTNDSIIVHQAGTYTLTITNSYGCTKVSTMQIFAYHHVDSNYIESSTLILCNSENAILTSKLNGYNYLWSTGSTNSLIIVNASGTYYLTTTDSYGLSSLDSIALTNIITTPINWPDDSVINYHGSITLKIPLMYNNYLWSDGDIVYTKTFNEWNLNIGVNKVWATASINKCVESDTILIIRSPDEAAIEEDFIHFFFIENNELNFIPTNYYCSFQLYSIEGRLIFSKYNEGLTKAQSYNLKSLNTGIYLLRITTSQKSYTGKIFVKHP